MQVTLGDVMVKCTAITCVQYKWVSKDIFLAEATLLLCFLAEDVHRVIVKLRNSHSSPRATLNTIRTRRRVGAMSASPHNIASFILKHEFTNIYDYRIGTSTKRVTLIEGLGLFERFQL